MRAVSAKPRHPLSIFVSLDEIRKVPAVFEQQRRSRRRLADVKARHRAKEIDPGDALHGWIDSSERVDQADRDVVAIDVVALRRGLARRSGNERRRLAVGLSRADEKAAAARCVRRKGQAAWLRLPRARAARREWPARRPLPLRAAAIPESRCPIRSASGSAPLVRRRSRTASRPRRRPVGRGCRSAAARPRRRSVRVCPARWISPTAPSGKSDR